MAEAEPVTLACQSNHRQQKVMQVGGQVWRSGAVPPVGLQEVYGSSLPEADECDKVKEKKPQFKDSKVVAQATLGTKSGQATVCAAQIASAVNQSNTYLLHHDTQYTVMTDISAVNK